MVARPFPGLGLLAAVFACSSGNGTTDDGREVDAAHEDGGAPTDDGGMDEIPADILEPGEADAEESEEVRADIAGDGDCDCRFECDGREWSCDSTVGLTEPLPPCTPADPCRCLSVELREECVCDIAAPSAEPLCRTGEVGLRRGRLEVDDGPALRRTDEDGVPRYACLFRPGDASDRNPYPLVVWLHGGGGGSADDLYNTTSLREKADPGRAAAFDLRGGGRPGFALLAVDGRRLHYPTDDPRDGQHHDFYHRDLGLPSTNRDISNLDAWIDRVVADGGVDRNRIYLMGWSNGCFFAQLYAFARHDRGTPAGNRPAAVACYSGADPFENINRDQTPSCRLASYPATDAPILLVGRDCDNPTCDQAQADRLIADGVDIEPGHVAAPWVSTCLAGVAPAMQRIILDHLGRTVPLCLPPEECDAVKAVFNHIRWPDGRAFLDTVDQEPTMLEFLRTHPLS